MATDVKYIKIPISLGIKINEILEEKIQFKPRTNNMGIMSFEYTIEELELIDKLYIENPSSNMLEGIELLPNLKSLSIKSIGDSSYMQDKNVYSINDKDSKYISKCKNLEYLCIENQAKLGYIDLTDMKKINTLSINNNLHLDCINGLWQFDCVGNELLTKIHKLNDIIMNNEELTGLNLDLLLFPDAVGYDARTGNLNEETIKKFEDMSVSWQETLSSGRNIKINNYQMMKMHKKAKEALDDYVPNSNNKEIIVLGIELYLAENVKYDKESLNHNHSYTYDSDHDNLSPIVVGPIGGANGAYNAFTYGICVCEGYTRAMQYLLRLKDIKSHNVDCISGEDKLHMSDDKGDDMYKVYKLPDDGYHSIISIDDVDFLYDDPCWNAGRYQRGDKSFPWTLLTKEEISKDHTLSFAEKNIDNNTCNIPRSEVQNVLSKISNYREERRKQKDINKSKEEYVISPNQIGKKVVYSDIDKKDTSRKIIDEEVSEKRKQQKNNLNIHENGGETKDGR